MRVTTQERKTVFDVEVAAADGWFACESSQSGKLFYAAGDWILRWPFGKVVVPKEDQPGYIEVADDAAL